MTKKYVGLDVHMASTSFCVRTAKGKVLSQGIVETTSQALLDFVRGISGEVHLTFEEGTQASWLYDLLRPHVAVLIVCDPRKNATKEKGNKNDRIDAERLSDLLRLGSLKPVYHGEHGTRGLKELVRAHRDFVRDVVRVKNRVKAIYRSRGIPVPGGSVYKRKGRDSYVSRLKGAELRQRVEWHLKQLDSLEVLRRESESALQKEGRRHRGCRILRSVPGIGPIRAAQVVGVVDTPYRFRTKRKYWSYVGLAVVMRSSSDYVPTPRGFVRKTWQSTRGLNRQCNRFLKSVYKGAAKDAIAKYPSWKAYYEKQIERGLSPEIARVAVARRLAAISLTVWKKGERYTQAKALK
jgi:transposase